MFKYCPKCGSESVDFKEDKKISCEKCQFEYYHNVAGAVAVLIKKGDEILFTKRNKDPQKGKWDLPGGFIDPHESAEECCVREIFEELHIKLDITKLHYVDSAPNTYLYKNILYHTIDLFFEIESSEDIVAYDSEELDGFEWKKIADIQWEDIAFDSQRKVLAKGINKI